jgi:YYY domain-containing protein
MSWLSIIRLIVIWYATVQLIAVAALPLTLRVLRALPDRGYGLAKFSGMLLIGVVYWLAYSYGLLRNERGGVWIAFVIVAATSWIAGWSTVVAWWQTLRHDGRLRALLATEAIFALAFVGWAIVRAYDPSVNHTEQPMDLMFMNSIWSSPTFPPQDAWLAGYSISYYYLGYWLLATLGRLANTPPNLAYNLGQAAWYGYLWVGCFTLVLNLVAWRFSRPVEQPSRKGDEPRIPLFSWLSIFGGFLGGLAVAFVGNLQIILEWLYAQGVNIDGLAKLANVHEFPERASQTGQWFISQEWWWWRSSRVIQDTDLLGRYHDVIDEFPMFSYLLGDNHPHVMAMPIVLLIVALALNLFLLLTVGDESRSDAHQAGWLPWLPLDGPDIALYLTALGSLVFANTWDYPPYWLLLVAVVLLGTYAWRWAIAVGGLLFLGTILLFLPYFLTAQSQASCPIF